MTIDSKEQSREIARLARILMFNEENQEEYRLQLYNMYVELIDNGLAYRDPDHEVFVETYHAARKELTINLSEYSMGIHINPRACIRHIRCTHVDVAQLRLRERYIQYTRFEDLTNESVGIDLTVAKDPLGSSADGDNLLRLIRDYGARDGIFIHKDKAPDGRVHYGIIRLAIGQMGVVWHLELEGSSGYFVTNINEKLTNMIGKPSYQVEVPDVPQTGG